ncbi:hypothetical protein FAX13_03625 [Ligilactobacillus animalis]|nr:hypothetical protein FAX13_03625 [Ligilactobacillus animalis]
MAKRLVYYVDSDHKLQQQEIEFKWFSGFSVSQKQKSVDDLHKNFLKKHPKLRIIEISTAGSNELGTKLSAVNLNMKTTKGIFTVEQLFQAGKSFKKSGNNLEFLKLDGREARRINKQRNSEDELIGFELFGKKFPLEPKTLFYNWLYLCALKQHKDLQKALLDYSAFTDIYAAPDYTLNTQAEACALYVSLCKQNLWTKAMLNVQNFKEVVYDTKNEVKSDKDISVEQLELLGGR